LGHLKRYLHRQVISTSELGCEQLVANDCLAHGVNCHPSMRPLIIHGYLNYQYLGQKMMAIHLHNSNTLNANIEKFTEAQNCHEIIKTKFDNMYHRTCKRRAMKQLKKDVL